MRTTAEAMFLAFCYIWSGFVLASGLVFDGLVMVALCMFAQAKWIKSKS